MGEKNKSRDQKNQKTKKRVRGKDKRRIKRLIQNVSLRIANEDTLASFFNCSFFPFIFPKSKRIWLRQEEPPAHLLKIRAYLLRLVAFAKFGTPFPSVVFCPIRLLIGPMGGRKRNTDLLELHIQLIICLQKESSILAIQGRQIIQLLLGLRRRTLVFQKLEQFSIKCLNR